MLISRHAAFAVGTVLQTFHRKLCRPKPDAEDAEDELESGGSGRCAICIRPSSFPPMRLGPGTLFSRAVLAAM